jgi:hypothetical protein
MDDIVSLLPVIFFVLALTTVFGKKGKKQQNQQNPQSRLPRSGEPSSPVPPAAAPPKPAGFKYQEEKYPYAAGGKPAPAADPLLRRKEELITRTEGREGAWGDEGREYGQAPGSAAGRRQTADAAEEKKRSQASGKFGIKEPERERQETAPVPTLTPTPALLPGLDKNSLAYSVVMAEVLGKPRALKGLR